MLPKSIKNFPKITECRLKVHTQRNNVIQVTESILPQKTAQNVLHCTLKRGWGVTQAKAHHFMLKKTVLFQESCLLPIFWMNGYLPISRQKIQSKKIPISAKSIEALLDSGYQKTIFNSVKIQLSHVDAPPNTAILFSVLNTPDGHIQNSTQQ